MKIQDLKLLLETFKDDQQFKIVGQSGIEWQIESIQPFKDSETIRIKLK